MAASSLEARLRVMPAVVVTGARQTGKSTLAREFPPEGRRFLSLDDLDVFDAARRDPQALLGGNEPVTLDEVQREPELLHAVKRDIDSARVPGKFLLTGSANLLLMRGVSESLAGRASYLALWPMTRREQLGLGRAGSWEDLLRYTRRGLARPRGRAARRPRGLARAGPARRLPPARGAPRDRRGPGNLVRRLRADLPGA